MRAPSALDLALSSAPSPTAQTIAGGATAPGADTDLLSANPTAAAIAATARSAINTTGRRRARLSASSHEGKLAAWSTCSPQPSSPSGIRPSRPTYPPAPPAHR